MVSTNSTKKISKLVTPNMFTPSPLLSRQSGLPGCGTPCLTAVSYGDCKESDSQCLCMSVAYVSAVKKCFQETCSTADAVTAYNGAVALCNSIGVDINTVTSSQAAIATVNTGSAVTSVSPTGSITSAAPFESASNTSSHEKSSTGPIVGGVVGGVLGLVLIGVLVYLCRRRAMRQPKERARDVLEDGLPSTPGVKADMAAMDFPEPTPYVHTSPQRLNPDIYSSGSRTTSIGAEVAAQSIPVIRSEMEKVGRGENAIPYPGSISEASSMGGSGRQEVPLGQEEMIQRIAATVAAMLRDDPPSGGTHVPPPGYDTSQPGRL